MPSSSNYAQFKEQKSVSQIRQEESGWEDVCSQVSGEKAGSEEARKEESSAGKKAAGGEESCAREGSASESQRPETKWQSDDHHRGDPWGQSQAKEA
jgi:hypothetical protein